MSISEILSGYELTMQYTRLSGKHL